jgi:phosphate starvation-inducible PhoH-like protein
MESVRVFSRDGQLSQKEQSSTCSGYTFLALALLSPRCPIDNPTATRSTQSLELSDPVRLRELSGELGDHLRIISEILDVEIQQRGGRFELSAKTEMPVRLGAKVLQELYDLLGQGLRLSKPLVAQACRLARAEPDAPLRRTFGDVVCMGRRKRAIFPRSPNQRRYVDAIRGHDIVFGVGPAGTGKTYLAMAMAVAALVRQEVERIVLCRPAVEAGENLGYLPGDMVEKVDPYLRPLYDALDDMVEPKQSERLMERGVIEVAPLAFMRGRTLSNAYVILDEAQNTTREQMKMLLTRIGTGSRAIITGDVSQIDLPRGRASGLVHARQVLSGIDKIAFVHFTHEDVVRHSLVAAIIQAYDRNPGEHKN